MPDKAIAGLCYLAAMALVTIAAFMASVTAGFIVMAICLAIVGAALGTKTEHED